MPIGKRPIELANSLEFGPFSGRCLYPRDIDLALDTVQKLNATAVMVNDHTRLPGGLEDALLGPGCLRRKPGGLPLLHYTIIK